MRINYWLQLIERPRFAFQSKTALDEADLEGKGYTLHLISHPCATHVLENEASVRYVQKLFGHECLNTTQRYTRPNTDRIEAVYRTYHPKENGLYEELDEDYKQKAFTFRDELIRNKEAHRLKCFGTMLRSLLGTCYPEEENDVY